MTKYKLNKDKKETSVPSEEVINKHKSFSDLRTQYDDIVKRPNQPLYKNRKLFLFIILIALAAYLIAEFGQ